MNGDINIINKANDKLQDEKRCVALRKNCVCGYHYQRTDLYHGKGKNTRKKGPPLPCPECGRPRERCRKPRLSGTNVCRSHGGKGIIKKSFIPGYSGLDDEEILTLEELMANDDMSLKREFHIIRIFLGRAIEQFNNSMLSTCGDSSIDLIGETHRFVAIVDRLSSIAEKRVRIQQIAPQPENVVRIEFDDPRLEYHLKEALREAEYNTIRRVLAVVMKYVDPTGEMGVEQKLPASFRPYLPSSTDDDNLDVPNSNDGLVNMD